MSSIVQQTLLSTQNGMRIAVYEIVSYEHEATEIACKFFKASPVPESVLSSFSTILENFSEILPAVMAEVKCRNPGCRVSVNQNEEHFQ